MSTFVKDIGFIIAYSLGYYVGGILTGNEMTEIDFCCIVLILLLFRISKIYDLLKQRQCCKKD